VNGVCVTVTGGHDDRAGSFAVDLMGETLRRSSLGRLVAGSRVNLERALRADARLGGHVVQGHIDTTAVVTRRTPSQNWELVRFQLPRSHARYLVDKGSVAVDGVSLTVADLSAPGEQAPWFDVGLIPATLDRTTLGGAPVGTLVNIEVDVLAKHVERLCAERLIESADGRRPEMQP
jgi:riboflavin synthase